MNRLPFSTGRDWIRQGFALFRKQPGMLSAMFLAYLLFMLVAGIIPYVGAVFETLFLPMLTAAFMLACQRIDRGERAMPALLVQGFRQPFLRPLLMLGVVYLAVGLLAVGVTMLVDGGLFWEVASGKLDPKTSPEVQARLFRSMMVAGGISLPITLSLCFTVPLILWQRMGLGKALFYSFFAALREWMAFVGFVLAWLVMLMAISFLVALLALAFKQFAVLLIMPLTVTLWIVLNCSFYAAYKQVFGAPGAEPLPA